MSVSINRALLSLSVNNLTVALMLTTFSSISFIFYQFMLHYSCIKKKKICSKIKFHPLEALNIIVIFLLLLRTSEENFGHNEIEFSPHFIHSAMVPIQFQKFYGSCMHGSIKKQFFFFPNRLVLFLILTFISPQVRPRKTCLKAQN